MSNKVLISALAVFLCTPLFHAPVSAQTPFPGLCRIDHDDYSDGTVGRLSSPPCPRDPM